MAKKNGYSIEIHRVLNGERLEGHVPIFVDKEDFSGTTALTLGELVQRIVKAHG